MEGSYGPQLMEQIPPESNNPCSPRNDPSTSPENAKDWETLYNDAVEKSWLHVWTSSEFTRVWSSLIENVSISNDPTERFFDCCVEAIQNVPYSPGSNNRDWAVILNLFYEKISSEAIKSSRIREVQDLARTIFSSSYSRNSHYWNIVRRYIRNTLQDDSATEELLNTYKEQFSLTYPDRDIDYERFKAWAKQSKIDKPTMLSVQEIFMKEEQEHERKYPYPDFLNTEDNVHHVPFMSWVEGETREHRLLTMCEEMLSEFPDNACYYVAYLVALAKQLDLTNSDAHKKRLFYLIKRGVTHISQGCDGMSERFIELSLVLAGEFLEVRQLLNLIEFVEKSYDQNSWALFIASRKAIISVLFDNIRRGQLEKDVLSVRFKSCVTELSGGVFPGEFMELVEQYISYEQSLKSLNLNQVCDIWREIIGDNCDPNMLLSFTHFIRLRGTLEETDKVYKESIASLENTLNQNSSLSNLHRLGYLQLLRNYLAFKFSHGSLKDQRELCKKIAQKHSELGLANSESYWLTPNVDHIGTHQVYYKEQEGKNHDEQSTGTDAEVSSRLNDVKMGDNDEDLRIFLSNIDFKVKETEIKAAFQVQNIEVLSISLKKNPKGLSEGYGTVQVLNKDQQNHALFLNRIMIGKREAFISRFEEKKKPAIKKKAAPVQPTLLVVSAPATELEATTWADAKKLEATFAPFGHVKSITVEDKSDPITAKIEFHMSEDAYNAYYQWKEKVIFKDLPITMRIGFAKNVEKRKLEHKTKPKDMPKPVKVARFLPEGEVRKDPEVKKPELIPTQAKFTSFVPTQVKKKEKFMKERISVPVTVQTNQDVTPMDEDHSECETKPASMNNQDFRNLLMKK